MWFLGYKNAVNLIRILLNFVKDLSCLTAWTNKCILAKSFQKEFKYIIGKFRNLKKWFLKARKNSVVHTFKLKITKRKKEKKEKQLTKYWWTNEIPTASRFNKKIRNNQSCIQDPDKREIFKIEIMRK